MSITDNIPDEEGTDVHAAEAAYVERLAAKTRAQEARAAADKQALKTGGTVAIDDEGNVLKPKKGKR